MKMNPPVVYNFESSAEEKVFSLLKKAEPQSATAFHSLNIPKHETKQFGEADFVIVSNRGVLILEVKGGRLSSHQGVWYTKNRYDVVNKLKESPLIQAKTAWKAIKKMLDEKSFDFDINKVNFGYGVIFPDVNLGDIGIELTKTEVFDAIDINNNSLGQWIESLYKYWSKKTKKNERLNEHEVASICSTLRTEFDRERSLLAEVNDTWQQMISLTQQQYRALDGILANKQVVIEGGAGTGKTLIAIKASKILEKKNEKVLFICRSPVLASFVKNSFAGKNIEVIDFINLKEKIAKNVVPEFSVLIVDEGQDLLDMDSMEIIDSLFQKGIEKSRWYFFMDPNNQGSLYADFEQSALDYLKECSFKYPLTINCRNTKQIGTHTLMYTGGDIGNCPITTDGLPVIWKDLYYDSKKDLIKLVEIQLKQWIDEEGVLPKDITLLSPVSFEESIASKLDKRWKRKTVVINENYGERWMDTQLSFSTIRDFKGLENQYIMMIDICSLMEASDAISQLYVAMTRANSILWMATPRESTSWFDGERLKNLTAVSEYIKVDNDDE